LKEISEAVEPTILIVRNVTESGNETDEDVRKNIIWSLTSNWGYSEINVNELISLENERRTNMGKEFMTMIQLNKVIPPEYIARMLKKVIYSGDGRDKFILSGGFPFTVDHVKEFEKTVGTISAVIYPGIKSETGACHINGSPSRFGLDSLF
jgi:hypothetical protein